MTAFLAGTYTVTWDGALIGQCREVALEYTPRKQLITGDNQAQTPQDAVELGLDCFVEFTCIDWDTAQAEDVFWPYSTSYGAQGIVGTLDEQLTAGQNKAKHLILTDVDDTPSETLPDSIRFESTILAEGFPINTLFAPELREIIVRMRVYPINGIYFVPTYTP